MTFTNTYVKKKGIYLYISLLTALGMLSMITELFFLGHVPDVLFCPLSISYECITEEQLYLFELLGIPKPKESLSVSIVLIQYIFTSYFVRE